MGVYFILFFFLVFYKFEFAMDPVNFDPANGLSTPAHIYPEWYFLWSYEILRPFSKDIGLMAFGFAQAIFFLLPFLDRSENVAPANRRGLFGIWFWLLMIDLVVLVAMGKLPPEGIFSDIGYYAALAFFALWIALPIITTLEKKK
jgi:ubiquinol-cytochrome c reductase cytochrome b subunit